MRVFAHSTRAVHLGGFPMERLGRAPKSLAARVQSDGLLHDDFAPTDLGRSISDFLCALDAVREGGIAPTLAEIPLGPAGPAPTT
jgi:hypothetical protein